ncbi:alpha-crystallin A chain-like, partial [Centruroides sculpturatus]|uniref:alpha-crystallin A chain-like n=1 Tax=Centruroides sculpturatus TaxID=218467 RepID=UPI000C6E1EF2
ATVIDDVTRHNKRSVASCADVPECSRSFLSPTNTGDCQCGFKSCLWQRKVQVKMSQLLLPALLGDVWDYPRRLFDQQFGLGLTDEDFFPPTSYRGFIVRPRCQTSVQDSSSGVSEVVNTKDHFRVMTDVSHFSPEDITVKTVDNCVVIHGKHEEKMDQHGFVSREFTRRYVLPKEVDPEKVTSSLSGDGVLTVEAPKKREELPSNERVVPITVQRVPAVRETEKTEEVPNE